MRVIDSRFGWLALPWICSGVWMAATMWLNSDAVLRRTTEDRIRYNDQLIQAYARKFGEVPSSLSDLRIFAKSKGKVFQPVDAWGGRLEYLRLGRINYTLRSFGDDGVQNTLNSPPDPGVFRWGQMVKKGLVYDFNAANTQIRPSVALFAGADDDAQKWHAKLFLDSATGSRRILVRSQTILNLYMLAPHDGIEEFLFLPGGRHIVFSASGSVRYGDGIWIWDLDKDSCANLLEYTQFFGSIDPAKQARSYYVALASVRKTDSGPLVSAFIVPSMIRDLNPKSFFHPQSLHQFYIKSGEVATHIPPAADAKNQESFFDYEWMSSSTILPGGVGSGVQKAWLNLPRNGKWEEAMGKWQDFASEQANSPLAPYAVWSIALFYKDAAIEAQNSKEAEVLKGYSRELSSALSQMVTAPGWLRWYGMYAE